MSDEIFWSLKKLLKTQIPLLVIISVVEIFAGLLLESMSKDILSKPSILMLVPAFLALGGNLGITYGSRLSTTIHLGILEFTLKNPAFKNNLIAISIASISTFIILGILSYSINSLQGLAVLSIQDTTLLALISGLILTMIIMPMAITVAYISYRKGIDPDDMIVPIITATADVIGMLALSTVIIVLL
ncbi:MAG: hypothetical protein D6752_04380 [Candidatus Nitrosothermus koennekii]|nr:MAG: hypothetical protein D6752_04380 [Candidatus Nitrosothermus koennekii]